MLSKKIFPKGASQEEIKKVIKSEGFEPKLITDGPSFVYELHQHPETKLIVCLEGSMNVIVQDKKYNFEPGDKLKIPGNTPHSATVGKKGCAFYWSEKVIS